MNLSTQGPRSGGSRICLKFFSCGLVFCYSFRHMEDEQRREMRSARPHTQAGTDWSHSLSHSRTAAGA